MEQPASSLGSWGSNRSINERIHAMATDLSGQVAGIKDEYKYGFRDSDDHYSFKSGKGLNRAVVQQISEMKSEP
jgi:hypothetical protein